MRQPLRVLVMSLIVLCAPAMAREPGGEPPDPPDLARATTKALAALVRLRLEELAGEKQDLEAERVRLRQELQTFPVKTPAQAAEAAAHPPPGEDPSAWRSFLQNGVDAWRRDESIAHRIDAIGVEITQLHAAEHQP